MAKERFGDFLRRHRIASNMSMGQVARSLDITVVYYSEVEGKKKKPFPEKKVSYGRLGEVLGAEVEELRQMAEEEREVRYLNMFNKRHEEAHLALKLARKLDDNSLSPEQAEQIRLILEEGK